MDEANKEIIEIVTEYDQGVAQVKQDRLVVETEIKEEQQNEKLMLQGALAAKRAGAGQRSVIPTLQRLS